MHDFAQAARDFTESEKCSDFERAVLELLLEEAVGRDNAIPLQTLTLRIQERLRTKLRREDIQNLVIVPSRQDEHTHFVGTWHKGVFIFADINDVKETQDLYTSKKTGIEKNSARLHRLAPIN